MEAAPPTAEAPTDTFGRPLAESSSLIQPRPGRWPEACSGETEHSYHICKASAWWGDAPWARVL
jgi:hypothetical protein